jgi:hypothetical protein
MGILIRSAAVAVAVICASVASTPRPLQAQGVSTPGLTAAFIFSFVKFTTWPAGALRDGTAIVICVIGNEQIADALVQITYGKTVEGHPLGIRRTELDRPMTECHVVFGASLNRNTAQELIRVAAGYPILTVSDFEDFAVIGGVANFFIDGGRMRFKVNPDAAERQRLRISSNLLTLARVVRDAPAAR